MKPQKPRQTLDDKDMRILYWLDFNARTSNSELARRVGLSEEVARYRVRRLQKEGIIKGYFTLIDVSRLGFGGFRIYIKFQSMQPYLEKNFTKYLRDSPEVGWFSFIQGSWDVVILVWARDIYDFERFWLDFLERFGGNVERSWTAIFLQYIHLNRRFLMPGEAQLQVRVVGQRKRETIDELDWKILQELAVDSRIPLLDLESRTGQSYKVISYRIKRLERKGIILGYKTTIDFSKIGFFYYKLLFSLKGITPKNLESLERAVTRMPNAVYIDKLIGGADFEAEFKCRGANELRTILDSLRREFPDLIRNTETLEYFAEDKQNYLPPLKPADLKKRKWRE